MTIRFAFFFVILAALVPAQASAHLSTCEAILRHTLTLSAPGPTTLARLSSSRSQNLVGVANARLHKYFPGAKISPLGEGGIGVVYDVVPTSGAPLVAKLIKNTQTYPEGYLEAHQETLERIRTQQGADSRLVQLRESPETDLVLMEKVEGLDLAVYLKEHASGTNALNAGTILFLMKEAALALQELHGMDLVHGDVKPENFMVLLSPDGAPRGLRLIDFDLVRPAGTIIESGLLRGTPGYIDFQQSLEGTVAKSKDLYALMMLFRVMLLKAGSVRAEPKAPISIPQYTSANPHLEESPGIWPVRGQTPIDIKMWEVSPHSYSSEIPPMLSTIAFFRFETAGSLLEALGRAEKALQSGSEGAFYDWFNTEHVETLPPSSRRTLFKRSKELREKLPEPKPS